MPGGMPQKKYNKLLLFYTYIMYMFIMYMFMSICIFLWPFTLITSCFDTFYNKPTFTTTKKREEYTFIFFLLLQNPTIFIPFCQLFNIYSFVVVPQCSHSTTNKKIINRIKRFKNNKKKKTKGKMLKLQSLKEKEVK